MYSILQKLVGKKFYATREEAVEKASVFFACNVLTELEYTDITILINEKYPLIQETETSEAAI